MTLIAVTFTSFRLISNIPLLYEVGRQSPTHAHEATILCHLCERAIGFPAHVPTVLHRLRKRDLWTRKRETEPEKRKE